MTDDLQTKVDDLLHRVDALERLADTGVFVLIPDRDRLAVVDAGRLLDALAAGEPLEVAIEAAIYDAGTGNLAELVERVRELNATGEVVARATGR
jgi:hypothetical protein